MNRLTTTCLAIAVALAVAAPALAQNRGKRGGGAGELAGDYEVKFNEIANNCENTGMNLRTGVVNLGKQGKQLTMQVPLVATMFGRMPRHGKFNVKAKLGGTGIAGVLGKFSAAGKVEDGVLQMVLVAEYFRGSTKKPVPICTKTWNARGLRRDKLE